MWANLRTQSEITVCAITCCLFVLNSRHTAGVESVYGSRRACVAVGLGGCRGLCVCPFDVSPGVSGACVCSLCLLREL